MKTTKYILLTLLILAIKFGQAQTIDSLNVYPSPFCTVTTIHFDIVDNDTVSLNVYNRWGITVRTFFTNSLLPSGSYSINFFGDTLPNDYYIVYLQYGIGKSKSKKVVKQCLSSTHDIGIEKEKFIMYPNPLNYNLLNIAYTLKQDSPVMFKILDITGREVYSTSESKNAGEHIDQLNLNNISTGIYMIKIIIGDVQDTQKLVKIR